MGISQRRNQRTKLPEPRSFVVGYSGTDWQTVRRQQKLLANEYDGGFTTHPEQSGYTRKIRSKNRNGRKQKLRKPGTPGDGTSKENKA
jgi:hypothetical protein